MGQAMRMVKYDREAEEKNTTDALEFVGEGLSWYRLDDGVMGGQSETLLSSDDNTLKFEGNINTNGGGFCSIRAALPNGLPPNAQAMRIRFQGDGKTYKLTLSDGKKSKFGPSVSSPSWQADIPTKSDGNEETVVIPFSSLQPSWGGPSWGAQNSTDLQFQADSIYQVGLMLSLKLSDGSPNPKETFGEGIFPFSFKLNAMEPIEGSTD